MVEGIHSCPSCGQKWECQGDTECPRQFNASCPDCVGRLDHMPKK